MDENALIQRITEQIRSYVEGTAEAEIPVGVSSRHIHLSRGDLDVLFGKDYELQERKPLSQPGQFAAKETVTIAGPKGSLAKVRILGPERMVSQIELSRTDSFALGLRPPLRESGDLRQAADVCVIGPKGSLVLTQSAIVAKRHIHMTPDDAKRFGVANGQEVSVSVPGERAMVMGGVVIRVNPAFALELHIDTDEANACGLCQGSSVCLSPLL